jgi:xanthine dehydrogenase accessory factor
VLDRLDFSPLSVTPQTYVVVATHGNYDEDGLEAALKTDAPYVALVASRTRAGAVTEYLRESGMPEERLARLKFPAGLDIGAVTPEEIALSILAEIVQVRRQAHKYPERTRQASRLRSGHAPAIPLPPVSQPAEALDLVCGMTVEIATARYVSQHAGQTYYFCSAGCKRSFEKEPAKYLVTSGG